MNLPSLPSWGLYPKSQSHIQPISHKNPLPTPAHSTQYGLPYGLGRSYGDVCLNDGHTQNPTQFLDMFISFNKEEGTLAAEGGICLAEILKLIVPHGWFIPVSPGTKFVTLGGAIANDIHGKNHSRKGSFGNHVLELQLQRSNGETITCSPQENIPWFQASIGGLGLTGLIKQATIKLLPIVSSRMLVQHTAFESLEEFFAINESQEASHEYTVAWIDTLHPRTRGIYMSGDHEAHPSDFSQSLFYTSNPAKLCVPTYAPNWLLHPLSIRAFNQAYYLLQKTKATSQPVPATLDSFFYPLDCLKDWNKLYGKRGFLQYQCVIPKTGPPSQKATERLLKTIATSQQGSFLAVLKTFGDISGLGKLSFPTQGITLALDFPNNGKKTQELFRKLDDIVREHQGRIYPAKDAHLTPSDFQNQYPAWREIETLRDPLISSSFWRRVTQ